MTAWTGVIGLLYMAAMAFAYIEGRVAIVVWVIVAGNFIASAFFDLSPATLGIVDALTLALLIAEASQLSLALAFCFAVCVAVDAFGMKFGLQPGTTNTIVDFMILPIAVILGCLNGDGGNLSRVVSPAGAFVRSHMDHRVHHSLENGGDAPVDLAADHSVDKGVSRGKGQ